MQDLDGYLDMESEVPVIVVSQAHKGLEWTEVLQAKYGIIFILLVLFNFNLDQK